MKLFKKFLRFFALTIYLIIAIIPLYWILVTSLKDVKNVFVFPVRYLPDKICFSSYISLFQYTNFHIYFKNSLIVALVAASGALIVTIFSGYSLSRYRFKSKQLIITLLFFTQTVPSFLVLIPLYDMFSKVGMLDKLPTLMLLYMNLMIPFSVIMSKSFFDRIPFSIEEAAQVDGCTRIQSIFKIVFPLTLPGIAAIFSYTFINTWNELFLAVMFINSDNKMTIPVALNSFNSKIGVGWDIMSAGIIISLLPTIIIFAFAQRYIVAGLTGGAVKE